MPPALADPEVRQDSPPSPSAAASDVAAIRSIISSAERRAWHQPSRLPMLVHFLAVWVQIAAGPALYLVFPKRRRLDDAVGALVDDLLGSRLVSGAMDLVGLAEFARPSIDCLCSIGPRDAGDR